MDISEIHVTLVDFPNDRLKAFCSLTFENKFVVRNIKIIEGEDGLFIAMPTQPIKDSCVHCNFKNPLLSKFCNNCGRPFKSKRRDHTRLHLDIAHPITPDFRNAIQTIILAEYHLERSPKEDSEEKKAS